MREELKLRPSPPGVTLTITGEDTNEIGKSYSEQVRELLLGEPAPRMFKLDSSNPDGLILQHTRDSGTAIEAKYIEDLSESVYNLVLRRIFTKNAV